MFAQLRDLGPDDGRLLDLGTKGSGQTPWSRGGDGRLTLKGGVREVLATAQLEALGVYTSKSFSLVETGEELTREIPRAAGRGNLEGGEDQETEVQIALQQNPWLFQRRR